MENETTQEVQPEVNEQETTPQSETENSAEDTKDWKAEALKYKAIAERREKKLQEAPQQEVINKPNTEQVGATIEHSYLFSQGLNLEQVKEVERVARIENVSLTDAYNMDYTKSKIESMRQEAQAKANALPPSGGSAPAPREKTVKNMTDDEHKDFAESLLKNAING